MSIGVETDIVGKEEREWQEKQEEAKDKIWKELGEKRKARHGKNSFLEPRWQGIEEGEEVVTRSVKSVEYYVLHTYIHTTCMYV